jgi:NAD(P)H-flavin reductase
MNPFQTVPYRIAGRQTETHDTVTLFLEPVGPPIASVLPGQFTMLYSFGVGEVPLSVSGIGRDGVLAQTVRDVGAVSRALCTARPGDTVGVRGPYGTAWDVGSSGEQVFVAGGIGLAPLRPAIRQALRADPERVTVLIGARAPEELIYAEDLDSWRALGAHVELIVDSAGASWAGQVGLVTKLVDRAEFDAPHARAFVCGPEIMMRFTAEALIRRGVPAEQVLISLERNMKCGVGLCGHCQLGPLLICRDGPVVPYGAYGSLLKVREL